MKKLLSVLMLAIISLTCHASKDEKAVDKTSLVNIIKEYRMNEGFDVLNVGSLGTSVFKAMIRISAVAESDEDIADMLKVIDGIKRISVVDFGESSDEVRKGFCRKLDKILKDSDLLLEVKDDSETMYLYGVVNEDATEIRDFVMYAPTDCSLICLFGSIPVDAVAKLASD